MDLMHPSNNNMLDFWGGINLKLRLKYQNMLGLLLGRQFESTNKNSGD